MATTSKDAEYYNALLQKARKELAQSEKSGKKKSQLAIQKRCVRELEKLVRRYEKHFER